MSRNTAYLSNIYLFRLTQFYSGHLDVVNYFFPIRLNVLIVMGLGLFKCGLGAWPKAGVFWEARSPTFGEGPKLKQAWSPTFGEGLENLSFYDCCTISRSVKHSVKGSSPTIKARACTFRAPPITMYEQKYEPF